MTSFKCKCQLKTLPPNTVHQSYSERLRVRTSACDLAGEGGEHDSVHHSGVSVDMTQTELCQRKRAFVKSAF